MQSDERKLEWHAPENLRWLADQEGRPDRVPCGFLTGQFLIRCADKMDAQEAEITALRDRVARLTEIFEDIYEGPAIECIPCTSIQDDIREALGIPSWSDSGKSAKAARVALKHSPPATDGV